MTIRKSAKEFAEWTTAFRLLLACQMAVTALAVGCTSEPESTLPKFTATTPEAKLERIMERLDEAIIDASAARGSGVVSQRKSSYKLFPPKVEGGQYRAEVKIQTTLALAAAPAAATLPKKEHLKSTPADEEVIDAQPDEDGIDAQPIDESITGSTEKAATADDAEAEDEQPRDNGVTRRAIEQSKETRTQVYELAYENDQWKVVSEFAEDDELGPLLFEYALSE
jgi:hypothetical protein